MISGRIRLMSFVGGLVVTAACSQGAAQLSPAGPSAVMPAAGLSAAGWSTSSAPANLTFAPGLGNGNGQGNGGSKKKVSGVGTVANLSGSCEDDTLKFNVQGVRVVTTDETLFYFDAAEEIEGGCGNLRSGTKVKVVAEEEPNADGSFNAVSVTIVDQPGGKPPASVEGEGTVAALKGTCPTLTMVVHGYPVMTTSSTDFPDSCESILPGVKIHVVGVLAGNSVVADTVTIIGAQ